jgi:hypothetical protein
LQESPAQSAPSRVERRARPPRKNPTSRGADFCGRDERVLLHDAGSIGQRNRSD